MTQQYKSITDKINHNIEGVYFEHNSINANAPRKYYSLYLRCDLNNLVDHYDYHDFPSEVDIPIYSTEGIDKLIDFLTKAKNAIIKLEEEKGENKNG